MSREKRKKNKRNTRNLSTEHHQQRTPIPSWRHRDNVLKQKGNKRMEKLVHSPQYEQFNLMEKLLLQDR